MQFQHTLKIPAAFAFQELEVESNNSQFFMASMISLKFLKKSVVSDSDSLYSLILHTHVTVLGAEPIRFPKQRSKSISLQESKPSPDGLDVKLQHK